MRRQDKYPDTPNFQYYNANPKGKLTTDCVIRAIATATQYSYNTVLTGLVNMSTKTGYFITDKRCYERYLKELGWVKCAQPRHLDNTKYTGRDFCLTVQMETFNLIKKSRNERYITHIGGHHVVAIVDGKINDIWDSTDGCIGNYYYLP